jgi:hypothetical protein
VHGQQASEQTRAKQYLHDSRRHATEIAAAQPEEQVAELLACHAMKLCRADDADSGPASQRVEGCYQDHRTVGGQRHASLGAARLLAVERGRFEPDKGDEREHQRDSDAGTRHRMRVERRGGQSGAASPDHYGNIE